MEISFIMHSISHIRTIIRNKLLKLYNLFLLIVDDYRLRRLSITIYKFNFLEC